MTGQFQGYFFDKDHTFLICRNEDGHQSAEDACPWDRGHVYTAEAGCPTHVRGAEKGA